MYKKTFNAFVALVLCLTMLIANAACGKTKNEEDAKAVPSYETQKTVTDTVTGTPSAKGIFNADYKDRTTLGKAGQAVNVQLAEEGIVLLKNDDNALPLRSKEKKVSLFGYRSVDYIHGGAGSGAGVPGRNGIAPTTLDQGLQKAGFSVNNSLLDFYRGSSASSEISVNQYTGNIVASYKDYNDAAIVVFGRTGAEGSDLLRSNVPGHSNKNDHYLELDDNEEALIKHVKKHFDKVIVLLNSAHILEMGELNAKKTENNLGVDAILHIGHLGNDGAIAIGRILKGTVNPSGHTVDTWPIDFTKTPSYTNFGDNRQVNGLHQMYLEDGSEIRDWYAIEYREDIYVGYKYYETVCSELNAMQDGLGEQWYSRSVVYPFGYGLSYTTFDWELDASIDQEGLIDNPLGTVTMKVKVTNIGGIAGKDVVQLYVTQPYTAGGIEKASCSLMGFAKTKLLKPGESDVVTISCIAQDFASFDYDDKNGNGFAGYELEKGDYIISARRDAHDAGLNITRTIEKDIQCPTDSTSGEKIETIFSQTDGKWAEYNSMNESLKNNLLKRTDLASLQIPKTTTKADRTLSKAAYANICDRKEDYIYEDDEYDAWYVASVPDSWTQGAGTRTNGKTAIQLKEMMGVDYTEPYIDENGNVVVGTDAGSKKWDEFLNQLTWEEIEWLAANGTSGFLGRTHLDSIGKPAEQDMDGPSQLAWQVQPGWVMNYGADGAGTYWVSPVIIASSWNDDLVEEMGLIIGNECILLNCPGWYGPGMNIHRSPFGGRNFEYYSEDGVLSGKIAAAACRGVVAKGGVTYLKHMILNEQETNRDTSRGLFTYATEQAIREIYAKPFELAIKEGHANGSMNCANRIGTWAGYTNGALQVGLMRGEWHFKGVSITDLWVNWEFSRVNSVLRGGAMTLASAYHDIEDTEWRNGMVYGKGKDSSTYDVASPTQWYWARVGVLRALYVTVNTCGIDNGNVN